MSFNTFAIGFFNLYVCLVLLTMCYYLSRIYQKMYPKRKELPDFKFIPPPPMSNFYKKNYEEWIEDLQGDKSFRDRKIQRLEQELSKDNDERLSMAAANCKLAEERNKYLCENEMLLSELDKYKTPPCAPSV